MNGPIRIAQITDCHLPADSRLGYRDVNAHSNLEALLQTISNYTPDLLLATGDLSEDASPASYHALQAYFDSTGVPVLALPGNHDDAELLAQFFPGSPVDDVSVSGHGEWQIIRLNSCLNRKPEGRLTGHTLKKLEQLLLCEPQRPRLIALHHQPIPVGSPWIDKYRMFEPEAFLELIDQTPGVRAVVWGHVHQIFDAKMDGIAMLGGPSSSINSVPGMDKFTADALGPACRWLELGVNGSFSSRIITA